MDFNKITFWVANTLSAALFMMSWVSFEPVLNWSWWILASPTIIWFTFTLGPILVKIVLGLILLATALLISLVFEGPSGVSETFNKFLSKIKSSSAKKDYE